MAAASLALFTLPASKASASAFCSFEFTATLSPGLSAMTPTAGTVSMSSPGKITCHGDAYGKEITGPGTLEGTATYGARGPETCAMGSGTGDLTLTLPTADGPMKLKYAITYQRLGPMGPFNSPGYNGGFGFMPTKGDCFTAPITQAMVSGGSMIG